MTTTTKRTALILWTERSNGYFHIHAALGYDDGNEPSWGSYREVRKDGLLFDGLRVSSQGNDHDGANRRLYGWGVEYRDVYGLNLHQAQRLTRSLAVLERRLTKLRDAQGYAKTYSQFVGQVAQAVKATTFYFRHEGRSATYSVRRTVGDALVYVDSWEHAWAEAGRVAVAS